MALHTLNFEMTAPEPHVFPAEAIHFGVVGSGDMEVLIEPKKQGGKASFTIVTPVSGFNHVWEMVLQRFIANCRLGDVHISINDNNATPVVVSQRLRQALLELQ